MTNKILFIVFLTCSFFATTTFAQTANYSFTNDSIVATFRRCDTTQEATLTIKNNSSKQDTLTWKRTLRSNNIWANSGGSWTVTTCDNNGCYTAGVNQRTFYIAAGATVNMIMNVTPNGVAGTGIIDLKIGTPNRDSLKLGKIYLIDSISGYYKFNIACKTVGINNISSINEINIYPSPFQNNFTISSSNLNRVKFLEVYNVIGSLIYKQELNDASSDAVSINPGNISKGLYFVSLLDSNHNKITTKKIQKD